MSSSWLRQSLRLFAAVGCAGCGFAGSAASDAASDKPLQVGDPAPDFVLSDQDGTEHKLSDYRGRWVVLYFYPKDQTPGCTKQACAFRDRAEDFAAIGVKVFGINPDTVESHKAFAKKQKLNFPLLADVDRKVVKAYGVWGKFSFMGLPLTGRWTFVVAPDGKIARIYDKVDPERNADELLSELAVLKAGAGGAPPAAPAAGEKTGKK